MTLYGLADYRLNDFGEVIEFYPSRAEADAALRDVLRDEPEWVGEPSASCRSSSRSRCNRLALDALPVRRSSFLAALTFAGCSGEDGNEGASEPPPPPAQETTGTEAKTANRCEKVSAALLSQLKSDLKAGRKLASPVGVKSRDTFDDGPRRLQEGVYFVSADVKPNPGIATWAVSAEAWRTGGGLIFGIDAAARAVTTFGVDVDPSTFGLDEGTEGYDESRNCVG